MPNNGHNQRRKEPAGALAPENLAKHVRPFEFQPGIHYVEDGEVLRRPGFNFTVTKSLPTPNQELPLQTVNPI